jgi:hypothetical protein
MTDFIIRALRGELLTVHVKSPGFNPRPGEDSDELEAYHVLDAPEGVAIGDVVDIFAELVLSGGGGRPPRFVWSWQDFLRRTPTGRDLDIDSAAREAGISAFTLKREIRDRVLPASHKRTNPDTGGRGWTYMVNEHDLRWWKETCRVPMGRPKKHQD